MKAIVHIGMPKTGTTSLQDFLDINREQFSRQEVFVPPYPDGVSHRSYVSLVYSARKIRLSYLSYDQNRQKKLAVSAIRVRAMTSALGFRLVVRKQRPPVSVLSAEQFLGVGLTQLQHLSRWLGLKKFDELDFVAYVRNPVDWVLSKALEDLKTGHLGVRSGFFAPMRSIQRFAKDINELFGRKLILRAYEKSNLHEGDIRRDFVKEFFPQTDSKELVFPVLKSNESISPEIGLLLSEVRQRQFADVPKKIIPREIRELIHHSIQLEQKLNRPRPQLRPQVIETVLEENVAALKWLGQDYGLDLRPARDQAFGTGQLVDSGTALVSRLGNQTVGERIDSMFVVDHNHLGYLREKLEKTGLL